MNLAHRFLTLGVALLAQTAMSVGQEPPAKANKEANPAEKSTTGEAEPKQAKEPEVEITDKEVKLPGVTINRASKEVRIDAEVCLDEGILEYVVCAPDTFEHEAIFTTKAKPEFLHAALLLCGLRPTPQKRGMMNIWADAAMKRKDSRVKIAVEWMDDKVKKRVNLTSLLSDREDEDEIYGAHPPDKDEEEESLVHDAWIFSGSYVHVNEESGKRFYAANHSGILVGIWPDPSTVIQYGVETQDPYKGKTFGIEINEETVPKAGTKVKLVFSLYPEKELDPNTGEVLEKPKAKGDKKSPAKTPEKDAAKGSSK